MKITHIISDTNVGGAGVLLSSLASALAKKFKIEIILPENSSLISRLDGCGADIIEAPMERDKSFSAKDTGSFYRFFKRHKTDVIHTHAALSARLGAALAGLRPCISTRHCAIPDARVSRKGAIERRLYNFCTDLTVSTADFATKNLVMEGIPEARIVTIKNGVSKRCKSSFKEREALRRQLGIPEGSIVLGCCARLEEVKGQDLLLQASARLIKTHPELFLLFVGDGGMMYKYRELAGRLGILGRVRFLGYVSDPTPYQNIFDVNINTSRGTETSCLASSECMSLGIPTIASSFGGNREMISDGVNGLIFTSDDSFSLEAAIRRLISDKELYYALCRGSLSVYERLFSIDRMAREYEELYHRAAAMR